MVQIDADYNLVSYNAQIGGLDSAIVQVIDRLRIRIVQTQNSWDPAPAALA